MPDPTATTPAAAPPALLTFLSRAFTLLLAGFAACAATTHVWHA